MVLQKGSEGGPKALLEDSLKFDGAPVAAANVQRSQSLLVVAIFSLHC